MVEFLKGNEAGKDRAARRSQRLDQVNQSAASRSVQSQSPATVADVKPPTPVRGTTLDPAHSDRRQNSPAGQRSRRLPLRPVALSQMRRDVQVKFASADEAGNQVTN